MTPNPIARQKNHFLALDALRGVAAFAVVLYHRRWWTSDGHYLDHAYLAVDFFFVLSGFVIAYAYEDRLRGGLSLVRFTKIRLIRLMPLVILGGVLTSSRIVYNHRELVDGPMVLAMVAGFFALPSPFPVLDQRTAFPINQPTWSLFFEILINLLYAAIIKVLSNGVVVAIIVVSLGWVATATIEHGSMFGGFGRDAFLGGIPRTSFSFFVGVMLYRFHLKEWKLSPLQSGLIFLILVLTLVCLCSVPRPLANNAIFDLAFVVIANPLIIFVASKIVLQGWLVKLASLSSAISYPIYVLHYPLYLWSERAERYRSIGLLWAVAIMIAVASWLALKFYDEPVRRWLGRMLKR